jgi:hypothetical protein
MKGKKMNIQEKAKEILSQVGENEVLCMKHSLLDYDYFRWPESGLVVAKNWDPSKKYGNGLYGFLRGCGNGILASRVYHSRGLIFKTNKYDLVDLGSQIKCREAFVLYVGKQKEVSAIMKEIYPDSPIIGCSATAGEYGIATAGDYGTAIVGDCGTATARNRGTATAGNRGTAIVIHGGTATVGYNGIAMAGDFSTSTAGDEGVATAGMSGTATAGISGTATAGNYGTATAGENGIAMAGNGGEATAGNYGKAITGEHGTSTAGNWGAAMTGEDGTARAGENGRIEIEYCDNNNRITKKLIGCIGERGLQPNIFYKVEDGEFVEE